MRRRQFLRGTLGGAALALTSRGLGCGAPATAQPRVNLLVITADDMNWDTPGCQGGPVPDATPHIDRLASEGVRFEHAHVTVSICAPSRAVLLTGRYPHRNGALGFQDIRADVPVLTDVLRDAGYKTGNLGKLDHMRPIDRFGWETAPDDEALGRGRDPEAFARYAGEFMRSAGDEGRPFFLLVNSHDPHRPFHGTVGERFRMRDRRQALKEPSRVYRKREVPVPAFLEALPDVRAELAGYYSSSRRCDDTVGAVLAELDRAGRAEDTLVVFLSDNGMAFPFAKANCYLNSTRTPWIVRWPGELQPAVDREHVISGVDLLPSLLDAAGLEFPEGLDGRSILPLARGSAQPDRERVVTVFHETFRGGVYEMRAIQDREHGYIYNAWSDGKTRFVSESDRSMSLKAMRLAARDRPALAERIRFYEYRRPEELYALRSDPDALDDRSEDPAFAVAADDLRAHLEQWMVRVEDPLLEDFRRHREALRG